MKPLLTMTFIYGFLIAGMAQSQDWRPIRTGDTYFYFGNNEYRAYRIDSISQNDDKTIMFSFPELFAYSLSECIDPFGPSWLGKKFEILVNTTIIYNYFDKPITLLHNPAIGTQWHLYNYSETDFILAEVVSKTTENIGFISDSVITISLASNNEFNGQLIKISKNYGLFQGFNFAIFPNGATEFHQVSTYQLCGINSIKNSKANFTAADIFNFEIGDEMHTREYYATYPKGTVHTDNKVIRKVTEKNYNTDSSDVTYTYNQCDRFGERSTQQTFSLDPQLLNELPFIAYPTEYFKSTNEENTLLFNQMGIFNENHRYKNYGGGYMYQNDSCYSFVFYDKNKNVPFDNIPFSIQKSLYIEGLGGGYYDHSLMFSSDSYNLVYYKKGESEWGTPYKCEELMGIPENTESMDIQIVPNPASDYITCISEVEVVNLSYSITDYLGRELVSGYLSFHEEKISVQHVPKGILFVHIQQKGRPIKSLKIVKL